MVDQIRLTIFFCTFDLLLIAFQSLLHLFKIAFFGVQLGQGLDGGALETGLGLETSEFSKGQLPCWKASGHKYLLRKSQ